MNQRVWIQDFSDLENPDPNGFANFKKIQQVRSQSDRGLRFNFVKSSLNCKFFSY
jgi:hypothetical protein